jgi:LmbE family N-acetylglucosaminyl deacetylase
MNRAADVVSRLRALPLVGVDTIANDGVVMVLAPHADDESLGCGGLINELAAQGRPPVVVIVTDGTGSHPSSRTYPPGRLRALREREALQAVTILGLPAERLHFLRLRDTATPRYGTEFDSTVTAVMNLMRDNGCRMLCAPWLYDPHCDHEGAQLIARAAAKRTGAALLSYPVWGWLLADETPLPNAPVEGWRLDIQHNLELKRRAIAAHASQYSDLITDDPNGFRLPADLLSVFDQPYEVFLRTL